EKEGRVAERIDHFLQGVGVRRGKDGLWETIPEALERYGIERLKSRKPLETEEYRKYNFFKVSPEQAVKIAIAILEEYGIKDWTVYISPTTSSYSVVWREKGELVKRITIPGKGKRGLVNTLVVLAHEIEGHVLRNVNAQEIPLKLIQEFPVELAGIFSEAGAMYIEDQTRIEICKMPSPAEPYYFLALLEKRRKGSFKECFAKVLKAREKREKKEEKEPQIDPLRAKFTGQTSRPTQWRKAWGDVLRVFRSHTPLDDTSGYLPNSAVLEYLEQELVTGPLFEKGLEKLLAVSGVNPYWIYDLFRLGFLDLEKIKEPQMVVAKVIWPKIKEILDRGKSLEEAIAKLKFFEAN
ncbi:MAG: hypothetical protein ACPLKP_03080, partial [Microgenomates group bacterium]